MGEIIIPKNSRQMPKDSKIMANKDYCDLVYAWLQVNSEKDPETNIRYIEKKQVKFTLMAEALGISRQTVSAKFKKLLNEGTADGLNLITYNKELDRYELTTLHKAEGFLIQEDTLRKMTSAFNENTINIFIYLYSIYYANLKNNIKGFDFTIGSLKRTIGVSDKTRSNNYLITDILEILEALDLVNYTIVTSGDGTNAIKTIYHMNYMNNEISKKNMTLRVGREKIAG